MQEAHVLEQVSFQFCGNDLIAPSVKLAGPTLNRDQALLVTGQAFAFSGSKRGFGCAFAVHAGDGNGATEIKRTPPIRSDFCQELTSFSEGRAA